MKLWIDDVQQPPEGYVWLRSVEEAKVYIGVAELIRGETIDLVDIDYDAGIFTVDGGNYIRLLEWFAMTKRNYPIHIHSQDPDGVKKIREIIERNGWREVKMIEWDFVKGSIYDNYDCYKIKYKEHTICLKVIGKTDGYVLQWHRGTVLELQKPFDAPSLDEAKEYALNVVKNYVAERTMYWRDINDELNSLIGN